MWWKSQGKSINTKFPILCILWSIVGQQRCGLLYKWYSIKCFLSVFLNFCKQACEKGINYCPHLNTGTPRLREVTCVRGRASTQAWVPAARSTSDRVGHTKPDLASLWGLTSPGETEGWWGVSSANFWVWFCEWLFPPCWTQIHYSKMHAHEQGKQVTPKAQA